MPSRWHVRCAKNSNSPASRSRHLAHRKRHRALSPAAEPRFLDAGEAALVVEFGNAVEPAIHNRVLALDAALTERAPPGVVELVPTIRSLMIHYDPLIVDR